MKSTLESLNLDDWSRWAPLFETIMRVCMILALGWVLYQFIHRLIKKFRTYAALRATCPEETKRIDTLGRVFQYIASVVLFLVTGMLILHQLGVSIAPILGAAGVVGVAVGFGAQSLVKDYFAGLFLLLENQIRQGDIVEVAGKAGEVEEITLRYVRLRDYEGNVHFVPNGLISTVTNKTREYAYAVIEIGIAYKDDVEKAFQLMRNTAGELRNDSTFGPKILEDIEIAGVENIRDSAVTLRGRIKVRPIQQWEVRREFIKRLKRAFDDNDIEIPLPHMKMIYPDSGKHEPARPPSGAIAVEVD